ncbi:hypothetical protein A3B87_00660 [Candidatus Kuenenbacteria bacterium RIFCSPHIGHO2_02_FULL_39_13]|uniref:Uncharacterized protein n=1 Tax=Candidatus Kuenenbacteria bacterium RIFCSPHIGHO2_02_FULL_39_13 TaxID=1798561 RepID=A0A1F6FP26_9BACT|nr:MAG: hypothetical protein A3B87_00660 [Candidatus Kuenenbacteria bacterium RIFCSPHIGHO2_02_FULL_39_13]
MLEQKDYKKLEKLFDQRGRQLFKEEGRKLFEQEGKKLFEQEGKKLEDRIITQVGEMIEQNISPILCDHTNRLDKLEKKINNLPDKLYLSDKFADLQANVTSRQRKEDEKVNLLISFLKKRKVLVDREVEILEAIEVFPNPQKIS